jgi:Protein of unknown function (DUF4238)
MGPSNSQPITVRNHYVPQLYLKRWAGVDSKLWRYDVLVPHVKVPIWKKASIAAIGYHQHLYTRIAGGVETDEIEKWLNHGFEMPAKSPISKAASQQPLTPKDWNAILRFLWMQDARTPASFLKFRKRQIQNLPGITQDVVESSVQKLMEAKLTGKVLKPQVCAAAMDFPSVITTHIEPGAEFGILKTEIPVGRSLWLWSLRQPYTATMEALYRLKMTILRPPLGMNWITSDNPVVKLNFGSETDYDFGGGYGHPGTEILFPLSPQHMLYVKVGERPSFQKYQRVPDATGYALQKVLIEHAHRMIFSVTGDPIVEQIRPRFVSTEYYKHEAAQWAQWHKEQSAAEAAIAKP